MLKIKHFLLLIGALLLTGNMLAQHVFSVNGNQTYLDNKPFQAIGLRCPNALLSDKTVTDLISHLDEYKTYGLNAISVFFMGSRYSHIYGYNPDGTLNKIYKDRMAKIIEACNQRGMVVLVGVLYWGSGMHETTNDFYSTWNQEKVNHAIQNTVRWLTESHYQNVFIDPDNEGMGERGASFDIGEMICAGKKTNPAIAIAYNGKGYPPPCADLAVHFGFKTEQLPYIQTEGTPNEYWGEYSKEKGLNEYINVGIYTPGKKEQQLRETKKLLDKGHGYLFSSTWLQNIPPRYDLGGEGTSADPGIKWWLEYVKENYFRKND